MTYTQPSRRPITNPDGSITCSECRQPIMFYGDEYRECACSIWDAELTEAGR